MRCMPEPIDWPASPPTELPPPPDDARAVAGVVSRAGELLLELVLMACTLGFGWVGWWIIAWADGQSPAKVVLHLHVVRADDGRLASFGQMAVREAIGKAPAGVAIVAGVHYGQLWLIVAAVVYGVVGAVLALGDARKRTLWDRIAGTTVLEGDPPPAPLPTVAEDASDESFSPPAEGRTAPV